jgi:uncharacterized SAM-binding protein YcdF (DUF218 family)
MTLFLTKVLSFLVYPLSLSLVLVLGGLVASARWPRAGRAVAAGGALLLWVAALPPVGTALLQTLESEHPPTPVAQTPSADAIVVLGGAVGAPQPPRLHPDLVGTSDRAWHAARLYRAGKAPVVIASGGTLPWADSVAAEASVMERLLQSWGVPPADVLVEGKSATTRQNAVYTARLARERGLDRLLLVTSASHMPRALRAFRAVGLDVAPAPTDYRGVRSPGSFSLLPEAEALDASTAAIHEWVGRLYYRWRGWLDAPAGEGDAEPAPPDAESPRRGTLERKASGEEAPDETPAAREEGGGEAGGEAAGRPAPDAPGAPEEEEGTAQAAPGDAPGGARGEGPARDSTWRWSDDAWNPITTVDGVRFSYLFYSEADNENNGIVLRLENGNDHAVRYDFTVVFRAPDAERKGTAEGVLQAGQMKTGEPSGLFWIPFKDGRSIGEVGLRGIEIVPTQARSGAGRDGGTAGVHRKGGRTHSRDLLSICRERQTVCRSLRLRHLQQTTPQGFRPDFSPTHLSA